MIVMNIPEGIFKAYDIRGIYPTEIHEDNIQVITESIYLTLKKQIKKESFSIAIGRDMRLSSPKLFESVKTTLVRLGASIYDIGLVSTLTV